MNYFNITSVGVRGVRIEIVNSFNNALKMVYTYSLSKHTINIPCISLVHVETMSSLSLFTFNERSLDLDTKIPSIGKICHGRFFNIPYTWISAAQNSKGIFDVRYSDEKCDNYLR